MVGVFCIGAVMAGAKARRLYDSKAWKDTRKADTKSVGGLCERCMAKGIVRPAEIVHHKIPLTADNIKDLDIALSWKNLQALCRECHAEAHEEMYRKRTGKRYRIGENGKVTIVSDSPGS